MKVLNSTLIAAALTASLGAAAASAGTSEVTEVTAPSAGMAMQVTVNYSDLDLNNIDGQEKLYYRLSSAAKEVCGSSDLREVSSVAQANRNKHCQRDAVERALSRVNQSVASID